ncbi:hypothetical protein [Nocardia sp. NPDC056100]|uniref:hypothetical protein n=1 Tax=Nocardia sp. NPDC056100 TaxID=3345712 RepID=UPI0035DBE77F
MSLHRAESQAVDLADAVFLEWCEGMATRKITLTIDEDMYSVVEDAAARAGQKISPFFARAAVKQILQDDAARTAVLDNARDNELEAREQHAAQQAAEAAGHNHHGHTA